MMTPADRAIVETDIRLRRVTFESQMGRPATKLFLNRTLYLEFVMDNQIAKVLNEKKTYLGMTVYQASPLFGNPNDRVIEVA